MDESKIATTDSVTLIGEVHHSTESAERIQETLDEKQPDLVALELDRKRFDRLRDTHVDLDMDETVVDFAGMYLAYKWGIDNDVEIALVDQEMTETLYDIKESISKETILEEIRGKINNFDKIIDKIKKARSYDNREELLEDMISKYEEKQYDNIEGSPLQEKGLLEKRDQVIAGHLHWLRENREYEQICAVLGLMHLSGVIEYLENPDQIPDEFVTEPEIFNYSVVQL